MSGIKGKIWVCVVVAATPILGGLFFLRAPEDASKEPNSTRIDSEHHESPPSERATPTVNRTDVDRVGEAPRFIAIPLPRDPDPEILDKIEYPLYQFAGSGTRGAIRDAGGEVIWRASEESPVYSIAASPNDERIVVGAGDGNAYIITSGGEKLSDLPQLPPGKDMLGLGNWIWLDNERLLGESGVQRFDENGRPVGCCQGHNVSESRFYVYDLPTGELEEMLLPEDLRGKVVSIKRVMDSGEILMGHEGDEFGWYTVASRSE